jgi:hypothetical protein
VFSHFFNPLCQKGCGAAFKFYSPTLRDEGLEKELLECFRTFSIPPPKKVGGTTFKFYSPTLHDKGRLRCMTRG